jgi:hypothetical protein
LKSFTTFVFWFLYKNFAKFLRYKFWYYMHDLLLKEGYSFPCFWSQMFFPKPCLHLFLATKCFQIWVYDALMRKKKIDLCIWVAILSLYISSSFATHIDFQWWPYSCSGVLPKHFMVPRRNLGLRVSGQHTNATRCAQVSWYARV